MSSVAKLNLNDNWACDPVTGMCSASGEFVLPDHPDDAVFTFDGKVKGMGRGADGVTPRNFARNKGACNLPVAEEPDRAWRNYFARKSRVLAQASWDAALVSGAS